MSYTILGKKVLNEYIALGVYGLTGLGAWAAMRGGSDKKADASIQPTATATSDEEAAFLQNFINDRYVPSSPLLWPGKESVEHKEKAQAGH
ncbi:hypothetical protein JCM3774_000483 [Rhodotorula dairenensis]